MAKDTYPDWLKGEFGSLIDALELSPMQKRFLTSRWLDQVAWLEGKAGQARDRHYRLRLITVIGAVVIPALVGLSAIDGDLGVPIKVATGVVSLAVAVSAAIEEFFRFGERWRNYRQTVERLKMEGWLYFQLSGPYSADGASHDAAYAAFATRVEEIIQRDVEVYVTEVVVKKEKQKQAAEG